jgi:tryptophan halogenase
MFKKNIKILVVGGGTAGLISALILKKFLNAKIDIVCSKNIGIIGVGEGSTEHFQDFMNFLEIDYKTILKETNSTFKSGIMFENWSNKNFLHSVSAGYNFTFSQYPSVYAKKIFTKNFLYPEHINNNKIKNIFLYDKKNVAAFNQYHFDTYKLNEFLTKIVNSLEIKTIDDEIKNVMFKQNGEIDYLIGDKQNYNYDFYIDATGFKRLLIGKMGARWISFGKYLKMKSAIVFPTPDEDEYNLWTLAKAMDYGWRFKIPTWGRHGNGYIFDSDYITADQAKEELDKEFGYDVEIKNKFKFDPGYLENAWIKNCVAIGLSGSFVEPLEATSIGTSIQQSFMLMHKIKNYSENDVKKYNQDFSKIMINIRDFIFLHYLTNKNNSSFWIDIQSNEIPDLLKTNLKIWENRLPISEDFNEYPQYKLFSNFNYILIMNGLHKFNLEKIKLEYENSSNYLKKCTDLVIYELDQIEKINLTIGHKNFIKKIKKL